MNVSRMLLVLLLTSENVSGASQDAVLHVIDLQTRLTRSRIKSYSLDMTCVAQQSTFKLRQSDAVRTPFGRHPERNGHQSAASSSFLGTKQLRRLTKKKQLRRKSGTKVNMQVLFFFSS